MKTNSLALRLFLTAAAWVVSILPIAGYIIYARYRHEVVTTFDSRIALFLAVVINDAEQASGDDHPELGRHGHGDEDGVDREDDVGEFHLDDGRPEGPQAEPAGGRLDGAPILVIPAPEM